VVLDPGVGHRTGALVAAGSSRSRLSISWSRRAAPCCRGDDAGQLPGPDRPGLGRRRTAAAGRRGGADRCAVRAARPGRAIPGAGAAGCGRPRDGDGEGIGSARSRCCARGCGSASGRSRRPRGTRTRCRSCSCPMRRCARRSRRLPGWPSRCAPCSGWPTGVGLSPAAIIRRRRLQEARSGSRRS
jgi:hypothetical protein